MGECEQEFVAGEGHPCAGADFIEWGSGSSGWLYKYQIQGLRVLIYGFESDLKYELTKFINFYGSISVIRGENLSENKPLAYMPPDKFLFSTELDLNPITATLTLKKVSPQKRLSEFETRTDGYFLTDVSGTYIINSSNIIHKIIFRIDNIFDKEYYNHLSKMKLIMPEKGRSIGIQYRLVF
jgi:iron complex outermembrane receptor protein